MTHSKTLARIAQHAVFWLLYWVFISFSAGLYDLDFYTVALYSLSDLPLTILTTYFFVYQVFPLYTKKKFLPFFLFGALLLVSALLLKRVSVQYIQFPLFYANTNWTFTFFDWYRIVGHLVQMCAVIGVVSALKIYRDWKRTEDQLGIVQTEKRKLELDYLKAQTNPHFLFNTLNSIYYDVVNNSEESADSIIRLSELMRFVLHEGKEDFIAVENEIQLINNYIELQKRRYKNRLSVQFQAEGDTQRFIPPLICFTLIENAFKHGMSESIGNCTIEISLKVDDNYCSLRVKNPVFKSMESSSSNRPEALGLKNVNRQLTLIYGENYSLDNIVQDEIYICTLQIPLRDS